MERLWAPWRINYIKKIGNKKCIFCEAKKRKKIRKYVVFETKHSLAILNIFPYNNGHVMVAPLKHKRDICHLSETEALDLLRSLRRAKKLLEEALRPHGFNIGINISREAGAGITGHLHVHIVPRWRGDTNFMPIIFNTKVVSQSLEELHKQLKRAQSKSN
jgi:ATP adenylyltransferase